MAKSKFTVNESEKDRIRGLHKNYSTINEQRDVEDKEQNYPDSSSDMLDTNKPKPKMMSAPSDAGDYHMWTNCAGGGTLALYDSNIAVNGVSCFNAVNQGTPGLVLACNHAMVNAYGSGPVLQWGIPGAANMQKACWKYAGVQAFNILPNTAIPGNNFGSSGPATLSSCNQCSGAGDLAWMCTDVGGTGNQSGVGCQQMICPYPTITNTPGQCWDNQIDCNNGGLNPSTNANPCGGYDPNTNHDCINGTCVQSWQGQYSSLASCQNQCGGGQGTIDCINCTLGQMTQVTQTQGCPQGYSPVNNLTQGPCTECVQGNCTNIGWGFGQGIFNSMADCQASPQCSPPTQYECINNSCQQDPNGQYVTLADCQNSSCGQSNSYDCTSWSDPNGCQPVNGPGGQFATLDDCLTSPCQCDDVISIWPLYTNNPNIGSGSGSWYGSPHDGPSNNNAIQNQLNNLQGNPNFPGGNPVQQHKMKCKEAAMVFWLASNSNACTICSDPGFSVGAANSDPLGCVAQQFITMMDNFMVQHMNWPNNGCNWLTNALTNAQNQQTQYNPGSNSYCKIQGKIDFLNNFINTTQSTYLTGTATFTPGC